MISQKNYKTFVKSSKEHGINSININELLSGIDAQRHYLEVISCSRTSATTGGETSAKNVSTSARTQITEERLVYKDKDLFLGAQTDNHTLLNKALSSNPEKVNLIDDFGWSLLMIACQANSVATVKLLLQNGADTSVRDKAGNSAYTLVMKQKNMELLNLFLNRKQEDKIRNLKERKPHEKITMQSEKEEFNCSACQNNYYDKEKHLSSTIHNFNVSKTKEMSAWYGIPESNRGFQILVKSGWDRNYGLGPDGSGKKHPIKAVMKKDRKGLGLKQKPIEKDNKLIKFKDRRSIVSENERQRRFEHNFRREFL